MQLDAKDEKIQDIYAKFAIRVCTVEDSDCSCTPDTKMFEDF
jgi:hypothetical protein